MSKITFKGTPVNTIGGLPEVGSKAPDFILKNGSLEKISLADFGGKRLVLNIFPSLDTSVCATSVRKFNKQASELSNTIVLCISKDLPFAQVRFCTTEGLDKVIPLSEYGNNNFSSAYGVLMTDGIMEGLMARAVVVIDEKGTVKYTELVPEITQEPDYDSVKNILS